MNFYNFHNIYYPLDLLMHLYFLNYLLSSDMLYPMLFL